MTEVVHTDLTEATLCFPVRGNQVLLAEKQKKIGAGFLNGFGGKIEQGDQDIYATNIREVEEEIGIKITAAKKFGEIVFYNPSDDEELKRMMVHIFVATQWGGHPTETDEMKRFAWHNIDELDYNSFLAADRLFVPQILGGKCIRGVIRYNDDWSVRTSSLEEVDGV